MNLDDRMKTYYEGVYRMYLTRRTPVIIRVDSRAGHTFTKHLHKPFDDVFMYTMQDTMKYLCENIQGCVIGYTQSDEITLCLVDYDKIETDAWFGYNLNKVVSISASMATFAFNRYFARNAKRFITKLAMSADVSKDDINSYNAVISKCVERGLCFDSRAFNIPKEEVCNCFLWRQNDAMRNSIQSLAQSVLSRGEIFGKCSNDIVEILKEQKGIDWNALPNDVKYGSCSVREDEKWVVDHKIPRFCGENRSYVDELIFVGE